MAPPGSSGSPASTLGIAIVNYRSFDDTSNLVRGIVGRGTDPGLRLAIAVVDNSDERGRLEPVVEFAREHGVRCELIHGHGNVGYAAGNNLAAAWLLSAGADVLWVLNPDATIVGGSLAAALSVLGHGDRVIAATARPAPDGVGDADLGMVDLWTGRSGQPQAGYDAGAGKLVYVAGHSLLATRQAWRDLGGFCDDFFLFFEEADLCVRAARLGIATTVVPDLAVAHRGGGVTGATRDLAVKSRVAYFHASRSCMIFFRRHFRRRLPVAIAARICYAARALAAGRPAAAGAVVRGMVAGLTA